MKKVLLFILLLVLNQVISAQPASSVLWEIKGNGLSSPSYLFGTLKFIGANEFKIPTAVAEKIKTSKTFAIEDQVDHHAQHELNVALHFPKGKSL
ncbi:MAG: hypothetical protein ACK5BJ_09150, partial [Bacteroidota bacterium]